MMIYDKYHDTYRDMALKHCYIILIPVLHAAYSENMAS